LEPFVVCLFDINQRSELARLHKGDTVVVQGICKSHFVTPKGHIWDIEPMLTYCELATQKPTASTKTGPPQAKPTMPPTSSRPPSNRPAPDPVVRRPLPPASSKAQDQLPLGRVSANDLEATSHRVRYLLEKMNSEIREARDKNKYSPTGNAIRDKEAEQKQSEAILKAEQSGKGKIEEEFNMLIGKTLEWNWPVSKVEEVGGGKFSINLDYKHVALVRDRQMMNVGIGLGSLIAGEEIPEDTAKQLNPGDRVLIKGKVDAIRAMYFENAYGSQEKFFRIQVLILLSDMTAERGARGK